MTKQTATMWVCTIFKKCLELAFFCLAHYVKNRPTNKIATFAHMPGAAELTVKHDLVALKHKNIFPSTRWYHYEDALGKMNVDLWMLLVSLVSENRALWQMR